METKLAIEACACDTKPCREHCSRWNDRRSCPAFYYKQPKEDKGKKDKYDRKRRNNVGGG